MTKDIKDVDVDKIKLGYESGVIEVNGREYEFDSMNFRDRRKVFAYFTSVGSQVESGDLSFIDSSAFDDIEKVIRRFSLFDGHLLSKLGDKHFEEYPEDYLEFTITAMGVISYPFMKGNTSD